MGGFWDISRDAWNERALTLAGISADQLACVGAPAQYSAPLTPWAQKRLGLGSVPAYSCGNDNTAAAAGAGIQGEGDLFCSFGTAMVIYGLSTGNAATASENQIAESVPGAEADSFWW